MRVNRRCFSPNDSGIRFPQSVEDAGNRLSGQSIVAPRQAVLATTPEAPRGNMLIEHRHISDCDLWSHD
jgi:hypothetical protein